ncbi:hypothetical protein [Rhodococcus sp. IEGM 1330]|uniref:hypothetical protein n=1 Tax=Rhodococcus sp. IEGM 1330 TaxID=3082225 RepID=UPI0029552A23|nr:hypothetical protein [Rhodococcus sp. IEGM 1330]MDV8024958.1 hypothetical protein [Rhodococcus sp. IEGM 1330]
MDIREDIVVALAEASARNRDAQGAANAAAAAQRSAIFAAVDAGVPVPEISEVAGISRARVYALIKSRDGQFS